MHPRNSRVPDETSGLGKVQTKTDPLGQVESYLYEPGGKVSRRTDRKGQVAGVTYDAHGRPVQIGFGATPGAPTAYKSTVTLTWDKGNRITRIVDSVSGTLTRTYNALDQVTREVSPQGQVDYTYDKIGKRLTQTVLGQPTVTTSYDAAGRVTQLTQAAGPSNNHVVQTISIQYDAAGRRTKTTLANGTSVEYVYDAASQLTGITHKKADGSVIGTLAYTYDNNGKRVSASGSLAGVELPNPVTDTQFDANNRLTRHNGTVYTYDANGNLTSDGARSYVWDERDRLKSIGGAAVASFVYDSMGRRVTKTIAGTTTGFLFDGPNFVQELNGAGSTSPVKANLITGGVDETFMRSASGTTATLSHFLQDGNNNVIALTDSTQNIATSYKYTPYGETTRSGAANENSQQYTGRENDGTGLMYYRARYYHLGCNRFISEDPIGWASGQTNNYGYVGGDPVSRRDPRGLFGLAEHRLITEMALDGNPNCSELPLMVVNVDFLPGSQDPANSHWHAMRDGTNGQTVQQAEELFSRYVDENVAAGTMDGLARALHAVQDSLAGGHKGFQPWSGGTPSISHIRDDVFFSPKTLGEAVRQSRDLIGRSGLCQ